ncbi:monovalent cation:proton antiporter-2 (CPA2) family protein [Flavobacterium sp. MXW15]|uniref:Monovalent cation:proton antiporter-2 (CPA2) family protein n=1 Tax=Xanthomonas chitinilytica TaxID=2989819 RepID=A0ABT3JWA6_9XANT|nr:monovalent cation:proton antiporter-2 (CPA2) family protein [Xanthomonas sp. H13-6]MCW4455065.1 monovalent cation:proton antiporter-2 (CPA2) family protein [Flavobacterium sp. MXW15]MCW4472769.1 monovalent cation:proton antiporter-2 (CPA2) family protein [Xanthomonas sp. H13-6]
MATEASTELVKVVALLGAAVVAVPLFRRLGLGSVLGYFAAGLAIGPFGFGWFSDPQAILHVAELGVVMFLFVIGLEMRPAHLWGLRREIFGLGTAQVMTAAVVLAVICRLLGLPWPVAFVAASGFVLTSTAVVMQLLAERGDIALPSGQKIVSILLFEDLLIVPLLAVVAWMAPAHAASGEASRWIAIATGAGAIVGLVVVGRFLLNPLFRLLAAAKAREVMTAAALLVVLGAALLMQLGGLSMAMGAFLAGVLLSGSIFRHQIEADIEPFRGILLGLFFLSVGMALDLQVVIADWLRIASLVLLLMLAKAVCIYVVGRLLGGDHPQALDRAVLMAQGGEFAFVLFAAAVSAGVIDGPVNATLTAVVVLSMALTPLFVLLYTRFKPTRSPSLDGVEAAEGLSGSVLVIGFGRFGQVASQSLLARDVDVTIIDNDIGMIQSAADFGFKIYYGDGTRLDVLHASGAGSARVIAVCVDQREAADRIVELARHVFPQARLLVRSYDREHSLALIRAGVDYQIRETFESAVEFGRSALMQLGVDEVEADELARDIRQRDGERFELEMAGGDLSAGAGLLYGTGAPAVPRPTPFTPPRREARNLNAEALPAGEAGQGERGS